jgi:hypothetical protein
VLARRVRHIPVNIAHMPKTSTGKLGSRSSPKPSTRRRNGRAAMEALILVVTLGGPTMFARIGVMQGLNRKVERVFNPDRKDHQAEVKAGPMTARQRRPSVRVRLPCL